MNTSTKTSRPARTWKPTVKPIVFDTVELRGGEHDGVKLRVRRGSILSLPIRAKRGPRDRPPCAVYNGNSSRGWLDYVTTYGDAGGSSSGGDAA